MMRRFQLLLFAFTLTVVALPAAAQTLLATVPVGVVPGYLIFNPVTNKIYVENICGTDPTCSSPGSITVIDGVHQSNHEHTGRQQPPVHGDEQRDQQALRDQPC